MNLTKAKALIRRFDYVYSYTEQYAHRRYLEAAIEEYGCSPEEARRMSDGELTQKLSDLDVLAKLEDLWKEAQEYDKRLLAERERKQCKVEKVKDLNAQIATSQIEQLVGSFKCHLSCVRLFRCLKVNFFVRNVAAIALYVRFSRFDDDLARALSTLRLFVPEKSNDITPQNSQS